MIYLAFFILLSCIFVVYKEKGATRFFLFSLAFGWLLSVFGIIIYLDYIREREVYLYLFWKVLSGNKFFPELSIPQNINMEITITLMNFGVLLFIYSCLCFTVSFTRPMKSNVRIYILASIIPFIEFIIYSPFFYEKFYRYFFTGQNLIQIGFYEFFNIEDVIYQITSVANYIYLGLAVALIIYHYYRTPRLKYFQSYVLLILSGLISIILLFFTLLWWAPKRLVSVTIISDYVHILPVSLFFEGKMLTYFPYVTFISLVLLIYALYTYNSTYLDLRNMRNYIVRSIDITNVGIRFFTHMIKNYAMATIIDTETLKNKVRAGEDYTVYADRIISSSNELLNSLNEIKSKISMVSLNLKLADIRVAVEEALKKVNLDGIKLIYNDSEKPSFAFLDVRHMREVLTNMLSNAVYEMTGEVRILTVDISQEKKWAVISISDTGNGIEKENINKMFMPFYTTKNRKENWGLGLSYCYRVIMAHKGKIFVESEVNKGTTFKILLPIVRTKDMQQDKDSNIGIERMLDH